MKKSLFAAVLGIAAALVAAAGPAFALQHLSEKEAQDRIGDPKATLTAGGYAYEILKRSHRDSMNSRFSDAVIFSKSTNKFYYTERTDSKHRIVFGRPDGREEDPVTADPAVWKPIANALEDDNPFPHVFLGDDGTELAVVFVGRNTQIDAKTDEAGLLEITLHVPSAPSYGRRQR